MDESGIQSNPITLTRQLLMDEAVGDPEALVVTMPAGPECVILSCELLATERPHSQKTRQKERVTDAPECATVHTPLSSHPKPHDMSYVMTTEAQAQATRVPRLSTL